MQRTQVWSLVQEYPTCGGATEPNTTAEPTLWTLRAAAANAQVSRAHAPQQEKPPQIEEAWDWKEA